MLNQTLALVTNDVFSVVRAKAKKLSRSTALVPAARDARLRCEFGRNGEVVRAGFVF